MTKEKDSLQLNILQELKKTGFPTEVICADTMNKCGWGVLYSPSYWDETEQSSREFDLRAYKAWKFPTKHEEFSMGVYLIVECKKSEKPWVFFSTPEPYYSGISQFIKAADNSVFTHPSRSNSKISDETLKRVHHYFRNSEMARTFHEPFKGQEKSDSSQMIFSAIMSSVKATLFHLKEPKRNNYTAIYYPIIVFNGNMYNAYVKSLDNIELIPSKHIQLMFNYMLPKTGGHGSIWERQERFIIDIIHYEYLEEFLGLLAKEHDELSDLAQNAFSGGD